MPPEKPEIAQMIQTAEHALRIVSCAENYPDQARALRVAVVDLAIIVDWLKELRDRS